MRNLTLESRSRSAWVWNHLVQRNVFFFEAYSDIQETYCQEECHQKISPGNTERKDVFETII